MDMADPLVTGLRASARQERDRAWRDLYDAHVDRIHRLAFKFGVREAEVEDVTQRIFVIAHERLGEVARVDDVGAWLRGIGVRVIADHHRWWRVRAVKRWLVDDAMTPDAARGPEQDASTKQTQLRVAEVLERMSPKLREALVLLEMEDCAPAEVATITGAPVNTVRSRARLAREQFEKIWRERFGDDA
jgi:RNA polymerase sigma-70 factor (ECF subfamily)